MTTKNEMISLEEAENQIGLAVQRLALLHLAFSETLIKELGDERGRNLIVKAIRNYGLKIGGNAREEALKQRLPLTPENYGVGRYSYPSIGAHDAGEELDVDGEPRTRAYGCLLAKVWKEFDGEELGRLYCLVDPAQFMAFNPDVALVHTKAEPDGDDYCELVFRRTTEQEREDFANDRDWSYIDRENE